MIAEMEAKYMAEIDALKRRLGEETGERPYAGGDALETCEVQGKDCNLYFIQELGLHMNITKTEMVSGCAGFNSRSVVHSVTVGT